MKNQKTIGEMTITEVYPHLKIISDHYGLKLNKVNEFKMARLILVNLYSRELNLSI
jgi:hypothetical protein